MPGLDVGIHQLGGVVTPDGDGPRLAKTLRIKLGEGIWIDGEPFPWLVADEPITIKTGRFSLVYLPVFVDTGVVVEREP